MIGLTVAVLFAVVIIWASIMTLSFSVIAIEQASGLKCESTGFMRHWECVEVTPDAD